MLRKKAVAECKGTGIAPIAVTIKGHVIWRFSQNNCTLLYMYMGVTFAKWLQCLGKALFYLIKENSTVLRFQIIFQLVASTCTDMDNGTNTLRYGAIHGFFAALFITFCILHLSSRLTLFRSSTLRTAWQPQPNLYILLVDAAIVTRQLPVDRNLFHA